MFLPATLETERLRFRLFNEDDLDPLRLLHSDPLVMRYLGNGSLPDDKATRETLLRIIRMYSEKGAGLYATEWKATGEFAGRTGLISWTLDSETLWEVGYTLRPQFWGKGLATEAARFWKQKGFQTFTDPFLVSLIHPENAKSIRVAQKNGMTFWKETLINGNAVKAFRIDRPAGE